MKILNLIGALFLVLLIVACSNSVFTDENTEEYLSEEYLSEEYLSEEYYPSIMDSHTQLLKEISDSQEKKQEYI